MKAHTTRRPLVLEGRTRDIVDRAAELFDKRGYDRVSMEDIADAVGLAKPTLYHYVSSKDEILVLIHQEFMSQIFAKAEARQNRGMTAREELIDAMADVLDLMRTLRGHVRIFFERHRDLPPKDRKSIAEQRSRYTAIIRAIIVRGVAEGEFRDVDAPLVTLALFGMCNWAYQWYQPNGPLTPRQIAEQFGGYLLEGISANRGSPKERLRRPSSAAVMVR